MTFGEKTLATVPLLMLLVMGSSAIASAAVEDGAPFPVVGEQLDHPPPKGWKRAWMSGKSDGRYIVEYIPEAADIRSWREGYLAIERLNYPPAAMLKVLEAQKIRMADAALQHFVGRAKGLCEGQHTAMTPSALSLHGVHAAMGGGFCDRYGPAAPFGEGALVAFVEGNGYLFRIQYGWRPKTALDQGVDKSLRIAQHQLLQYVDAIKATVLCAGAGQPVCKNLP